VSEGLDVVLCGFEQEVVDDGAVEHVEQDVDIGGWCENARHRARPDDRRTGSAEQTVAAVPVNDIGSGLLAHARTITDVSRLILVLAVRNPEHAGERQKAQGRAVDSATRTRRLRQGEQSLRPCPPVAWPTECRWFVPDPA
jgi:hypothetical protein